MEKSVATSSSAYELSDDEILSALTLPQARDDPQDRHRLGLAHQLRRRGGPQSDTAIRRLQEMLTSADRIGPLEKVIVQIFASANHPDGDTAIAQLLHRGDRRWDRLRGADWVRLLEPMLSRSVRIELFVAPNAVGLSNARRAVPLMVLANAAADQTPSQPHPLRERTTELLALLDSDEPDAPSLAAHTLGRIGATDSLARLRTLLAEPTRDPWLRAEAALALARNGDELGLAALRRAAHQAPTQQWARQQLESLGKPLTTLLTLEPSETLRDRLSLQRLLGSQRSWLPGPPDAKLQVGQRRETILSLWPNQDQPVECRLWEVVPTAGGTVASWGLTGPTVRVLAEETYGLTPQDALSLYCGESLEQLGAVCEPNELSDPTEWAVLDAAAARLVGDQAPRLLRSVLVAGRQKLRAYWVRRNCMETAQLGVLIVGEGPPAWLRQPPSGSPTAISESALLRRALWVYIGQNWRTAQSVVNVRKPAESTELH